MSFQKVYDFAMEHDVANLAFYAVEKLNRKPDDELYAVWSHRRDLALVREVNQDFARQEIVEAFEERGIPYKELQGTVLKKLYPRPEYRTMSDLDFIVEKSRLTECGKILEELGYSLKPVGEHEIDGVRRPKIFIELHTDYFSPYTPYYGMMDLSFAPKDPNSKEAITELYLYNVLHIAKHYFAGGCGIRRVLDMYYLDARYGAMVDWDVVMPVLEQAEISTFAENFLALARTWFGTDDPTSQVDPMERYIFGVGLHGKRENYIGNRLNRFRQEKGVTFWSKVRYLLYRMFPGDKVMLISYPILKKHRILYPFFWIYRIIQMICGKNRTTAILDLKLIFRAEGDDKAAPK